MILSARGWAFPYAEKSKKVKSTYVFNALLVCYPSSDSLVRSCSNQVGCWNFTEKETEAQWASLTQSHRDLVMKPDLSIWQARRGCESWDQICPVMFEGQCPWLGGGIHSVCAVLWDYLWYLWHGTRGVETMVSVLIHLPCELSMTQFFEVLVFFSVMLELKRPWNAWEKAAFKLYHCELGVWPKWEA